MACNAANVDDCDVLWTKNLSLLPKFSSLQITEHLKGCGKKDVGDKGYKFFVENYIENVYVGYRRGNAIDRYIKGKCHRSQRKNEDPHSMFLKATSSAEDQQARMSSAKCSCKAGYVLRCFGDHISVNPDVRCFFFSTIFIYFAKTKKAPIIRYFNTLFDMK